MIYWRSYSSFYNRLSFYNRVQEASVNQTANAENEYPLLVSDNQFNNYFIKMSFSPRTPKHLWKEIGMAEGRESW